MPVKPIPEGFSTLTPHLTIKDAAAAVEFYKKAFGAVELERHNGPDGKSIMHATLKIGDSRLMLNDEFPEMGAKGPQSLGGSPVCMHVSVAAVDEWFARAVAAGAKVTMPLADMFWGDRYGQLEDPFGHKWSLATHIEDVSPEESARRMQKAFGGG